MDEYKEAELAAQQMKALGIDLDELESGLAPVDFNAPEREEAENVELTAEDYLNAYRVKPDDTPPPPDYTIAIAGVPTMPRGDLQAVKAKSKNGKTMLCCILAAAALERTAFSTEPLQENASVLYIDTEQNPNNTAALASRVKRLAGNPASFDERFTAVSFRKLGPTARRDGMALLIQTLKPALCVIDGIADLIDNFNDVEASQDLVGQLMQISADYSCALLCVLHTNKAKGDENMKGHLGTLLLQKASDVFETRRANSVFIASETDSRNASVQAFAFALDSSITPVPADIPQNPQRSATPQKQTPDYASIAASILNNNNNITRASLVKLITAAQNVAPRTAQRYIRDAIQKNLITQNDNILSTVP